MTVRPASPADHPALAQIFLQVRRTTFTWQDPGSFRLEDFASATEGEAIHVAENPGGVIAGFISVWEPEKFVHHLFVADGHRGRGVGPALLEGLSRRHAGPFRLKCVAENAAALAFYRRQGWTVIGEGEADEGLYFLMESPAL